MRIVYVYCLIFLMYNLVFFAPTRPARRGRGRLRLSAASSSISNTVLSSNSPLSRNSLRSNQLYVRIYFLYQFQIYSHAINSVFTHNMLEVQKKLCKTLLNLHIYIYFIQLDWLFETDRSLKLEYIHIKRKDIPRKLAEGHIWPLKLQGGPFCIDIGKGRFVGIFVKGLVCTSFKGKKIPFGGVEKLAR